MADLEARLLERAKARTGTAEHVLVRARDSGVWLGYLESRDPAAAEVTLTDARKVWRWFGAAECSELARAGTSKPDECKFPAPVARVIVGGVCEIHFTTPEARATFDKVKPWTAHK